MDLQDNVAYHTTVSKTDKAKKGQLMPREKEQEPFYEEVIIAKRTVCAAPNEHEYEELA